MKTRESQGARLVAWAGAEGSTVPMALIRIGLALLLWARWGEDMVLVQAEGPAMLALSLGFFAATAMMLVGLWTRAATATAATVVATMYFAVGAAGGRTAWIHHHHFLLMSATVLCALTQCGRSLSVDRWRALARARRLGLPAPAERGPLLGLRLMTAQLSAVYLWSAIDKCEPGFVGRAARADRRFLLRRIGPASGDRTDRGLGDCGVHSGGPGVRAGARGVATPVAPPAAAAGRGVSRGSLRAAAGPHVLGDHGAAVPGGDRSVGGPPGGRRGRAAGGRGVRLTFRHV
ncbi:hypothetical protein [Nannocystis pusilla]|uniref:hypothetical protein n=1 Tax=Nannocystis pusilla TaxID=889268 RepID=UPI003B78585F